MSGPEWKPGDVAMAQSTAGESFLVVRTATLRDAYWSAPKGWPSGVGSDNCEYRPLVVIDPEDREQVERLIAGVRSARFLQDRDTQMAHDGFDKALTDALREFANPAPPKPAPVEDRPIVHAVMYRDYKIGSLCDSGAWGAATLFSMVTDDVTCPGCRNKLDGGPMGVTQ